MMMDILAESWRIATAQYNHLCGPYSRMESIASSRHVREAVAPALVCGEKSEVDPSASSIKGEKRAPNRRGAARAAPGPWRREIMANPPNRHCARRPASRPLLEEVGPLFPAPLPHRPGGTGATRIGGNRMNRYPLLGAERGFAGEAANGRDFAKNPL